MVDGLIDFAAGFAGAAFAIYTLRFLVPRKKFKGQGLAALTVLDKVGFHAHEYDHMYSDGLWRCMICNEARTEGG